MASKFPAADCYALAVSCGFCVIDRTTDGYPVLAPDITAAECARAVDLFGDLPVPAPPHDPATQRCDWRADLQTWQVVVQDSLGHVAGR